MLILFDRRNALHHFFCKLVRALHPGINNFIVFLALGDQTIIILLLIFLGCSARLGNNSFLCFWHDHVVFAEGNSSLEGFSEAQGHNAVTENNRLLLTAVAIDGVDHV